MDAHYIRDIDANTRVEVSINQKVYGHYAKAYMWYVNDIVAETQGTLYLDYCEACIAAIEANKLPHGISFIAEDFQECECED